MTICLRGARMHTHAYSPRLRCFVITYIMATPIKITLRWSCQYLAGPTRPPAASQTVRRAYQAAAVRVARAPYLVSEGGVLHSSIAIGLYSV